MIAATGAILTLAGSVLAYLASPNQRAVRRELPGRILVLAGCVLLAAGLAVMLQWAGPATAVFICMTIAMLVWTVLPAIVAWLRRAKEQSE